MLWEPQKDIVKIIREKKGNYILAIKDNQKTLHQAIQLCFNDSKNQASFNVAIDYNKGHGRTEKRTCYATNNARWFDGDGWIDLNSIVMIKSKRTIDGKTSTCVRYFITNLAPSAEKLLQAIRSHWAIESMHWIIDITLEEDSRIVWNKNVAENESIARCIALNLLKTFRDTYRLASKKAKEPLGLLQMILFSEDDQMKVLLKLAFK